MNKLSRTRPSPAMVVASVALSLALAGSAVAGTEAVTKAISKSKVKTIAKKQAGKVLTEREGSLNVKSAKTADQATTATSAGDAASLGGIPASSYAKNVQLGANETTPTDSDNQKTIVFNCPAGTVAIGAGAFTTPEFGAPPADVLAVNKEVAMTDNNRASSTDPTLWRVSASETDDIGANWNLSGRAICIG